MPSTGYDNGKNMGLQDPAVHSFKLSDLEEVIPSLGILVCFHIVTKIRWDLQDSKHEVVLLSLSSLSLNSIRKHILIKEKQYSHLSFVWTI